MTKLCIVLIIVVILAVQEVRINKLNSKFVNLHQICIKLNKINEYQFTAIKDLSELIKLERNSTDLLLDMLSKAVKDHSEHDSDS